MRHVLRKHLRSASVIATPETMGAGDTVSIVVEGMQLGFSGHHTADKADESATCPGGHIHIYLDDLMSNPLAQESQLSFDIVTPQETLVGGHKLIAGVHNVVSGVLIVAEPPKPVRAFGGIGGFECATKRNSKNQQELREVKFLRENIRLCIMEMFHVTFAWNIDN